MREAAALIHCGPIVSLSMAATVRNQVSSMVYAGPAADRFRASIDTQTQRMGRVSSQFEDLAERLSVSAADVDDAQAQALAQAKLAGTPEESVDMSTFFVGGRIRAALPESWAVTETMSLISDDLDCRVLVSTGSVATDVATYVVELAERQARELSGYRETETGRLERSAEGPSSRGESEYEADGRQLNVIEYYCVEAGRANRAIGDHAGDGNRRVADAPSPSAWKCRLHRWALPGPRRNRCSVGVPGTRTSAVRNARNAGRVETRAPRLVRDFDREFALPRQQLAPEEMLVLLAVVGASDVAIVGDDIVSLPTLARRVALRAGFRSLLARNLVTRRNGDAPVIADDRLAQAIDVIVADEFDDHRRSRRQGRDEQNGRYRDA